jgi:hypothetical protein
MKKLLLTTALIGSTLVAGNAIAQTTVSGNLNIAFKAISVEPAASAGNTGRGFGNEQQINIQNKGKLNNGLDYAAGFSIENDGAQTGTLFNENVYIDFIAGNTTITLGVDHIQNSDRTTSTLVGGMEAGDMALGNSNAAGGDQSIFLTSVGADPAQAYGIGLVQTIPSFGKISALYVPTNSVTLQSGTAGDKSFVEGDSSAVELGFVGDLGVKGLNIHLFRNEASKATSAQVNKLTGENYGISYNFGTVTVGYDRKKTGAVAANSDITQDGFGVAYAVNPQITVAANYTKAEKQGTTTDAEAKSIALGYNLGAVSIIASYSSIENILGTAGADRDVVYLAARTSF